MRKKKIEETISQLLDQFEIDKLPIDVEKIARMLGLQVRYEPYDGFQSGFLFQDSARTIIGVNSNQSKVRQRFTIAHELGHFFLHQGNPFHIDKAQMKFRNALSGEGTNTEEVEANAFAAALLMPTRFIEAEISVDDLDALDDADKVDRLAKQFKVSSQALLIRLAKLIH
jgi:Zn-dependent peptidase ImmA (M78 family)